MNVISFMAGSGYEVLTVGMTTLIRVMTGGVAAAQGCRVVQMGGGVGSPRGAVVGAVEAGNVHVPASYLFTVLMADGCVADHVHCKRRREKRGFENELLLLHPASSEIESFGGRSGSTGGGRQMRNLSLTFLVNNTTIRGEVNCASFGFPVQVGSGSGAKSTAVLWQQQETQERETK